MKKITRLILLTTAIAAWGNVANAQSTIDFETVGQSWTWTTFENGATPNTFSVVANPDPSGVNTSATCAKYIINADGQPYAGVESKHGADLGAFTFNETNSTIKIMVYKSVISPVGIKFADPAGWAQPEIKVSNTKINQWEELTFDFSSRIGDRSCDQIIIFPDFPTPRTAGSTCYFDKITFNAKIITPPSVLATIDFETVGNAWSWTSFQNGAAGGDNAAGLTAPFANPAATGINTSANCLKFVENTTAAPWGGFFTENMSPFTISAANCYVKVMVYKDKLSRFGVKFEGASQKEILISNTKTNEWELMTFNFTSEIGKTFNKLTFLPDFNDPRTSGGTSYIDNISFTDGLLSAIKTNYADKTIQIYPTLFKSNITVNSESDMSQVVVRNLTGQTLRKFNVSGLSQKIELSDLISGNYLITVSLNNGNYSTQKIVKL